MALGNEYFDWDLDRPGMVATIKKEVEARERAKDKLKSEPGGGAKEKIGEVEEISKKVMSNTTRIIHDGTFPSVTTLLLAILVQVLLGIMIYASRNYAQFTSTRAGRADSPFRGSALTLGVICTILSQAYVGPPLRLHYHGLGELTSALLLSSVSMLFGILGHYTAATGQAIPPSDVFTTGRQSSRTGFYLDSQMWTILGAFYCFEQARIFVMHIHDIDTDRRGGKYTFCVRVGQQWATRLYVIFNGLCGWFSYRFFRQLQARQGMVLAVAGRVLEEKGARHVEAGWRMGAVVIGAYALPAVLITAKSLLASLGQKRGSVDSLLLRLFPGFIPVLGTGSLCVLVSVLTLVTPAALSLVLTGTALTMSR